MQGGHLRKTPEALILLRQSLRPGVALPGGQWGLYNVCILIQNGSRFPFLFFFLPLLEFFFSSHAQLILLYKKLSGRQSSLSGNAWEAI